MKSKNLHVVSEATLEKRPSWARAWAPVLAVCAGIFVASSMPASALPKTLLFSGQDKVEHGLVYGLLGFLVVRALARRDPRRTVARLVAGAVVFALLFGASDEFHQWFVPGRSVDVFDLLADVTGGLLGGLLAATIAARPKGLVT
jgi:VanZ family protein